MKKMWKILLMFSLVACQAKIENCECSAIEIYKDTQGLLPQITLNQKSYEIFEPIYLSNRKEINIITERLNKLQLVGEEDMDYYHRLDFLLKLKCEYRSILFVEVQTIYTKVGDNFFYSDSIILNELDEIYLANKINTE